MADTGELPAIRRFQPQDATTNPSLILKAVSLPDYAPLLERTLAQLDGAGSPQQQAAEAADRLIVAIGCEISQVIPGRISTEVDARLSFDRDATLAKARKLIALYQQAGVPRNQVLIKIAATWEGRITSYNVCYTKLLRSGLSWPCTSRGCDRRRGR